MNRGITRDGMVFYRSFYEAVKELPPDEFKRCVTALLDYGLDGTEPKTDGIEKTVYIMAKPQIDKNNQRYTNGKAGGRKSNQTEIKAEPNNNQTVTKAEPKDKEKDKAKDKEKDKDIKDICSEQKNSEPAEAVIITLPLNDKSQYPVYEGAVQKWAELYPAVDVIQQLRNMKGWLEANPTRRKTKSGVLRFITAWLSREQDKGGKTEKPQKDKFNFEQRDWDFEELERLKRAELLKNAEEIKL